MRQGIAPRAHLFVCANRREGSPLGPGCGDHGERVFTLLKEQVISRGLVRDTWVTKTACLGLCPKTGATVAIYPRGDVRTEVLPSDVPDLLALASAPR